MSEEQPRGYASRTNGTSPTGRWTRFSAGLLLLSLIVVALMSGATPPGVCGTVLRHNQEHNIDASPLFYSEVDNMYDLIHALETRTQRPRSDPHIMGK